MHKLFLITKIGIKTREYSFKRKNHSQIGLLSPININNLPSNLSLHKESYKKLSFQYNSDTEISRLKDYSYIRFRNMPDTNRSTDGNTGRSDNGETPASAFW
ncbi:hypothetical protein DWZ32_06255 [Bacteroides intestinalis]|jgi:hypothetical protein|uniref:Uncharacterized protein n=1 Tax=Bacteroides intestinalis TaxID=329854 RepID=A0AAQ0RSJ1_9BACE|nr:hypothetical protein DWX27_07570 [Bacteroides intestinalis]RHN08768.1 hypothetical protein DWZ32_06255 [Bacteroides intestinalis]